MTAEKTDLRHGLMGKMGTDMRGYKRVVAEINLDAIENNYKAIRASLPDTTAFCAVVKADGYGHGALPIAKKLQSLGAEAFAVATVDEALALRENGVEKDILVLGYGEEWAYEAMIRHGIIQSVYREEMAHELSAVAEAMGKPGRVHLLMDTGMERLGFRAEPDNVTVIKRICALPGLSVEGIFSHFARSDERDKAPSHRQQECFDAFVAELHREGLHFDCRHFSNSGGCMDIPSARYDMVRIGIALYGLYPSEEVTQSVALTPALSLKSRVVLTKTVPKGRPISYGGTYITPRESRIATIPVGYGDGYPRGLSSKGHVLIQGRRAPIVGRVCMDQFMVDVTDIPEVVEGDEVILIGTMGEAQITVEDIAAIMGTINYEVVCQLGKRIPRVYISHDRPVASIDYFG